MPDETIIEPTFRPEHKGLGLVHRIRRDPLAYFMNLANTCGNHAWLSLLGSPVLFLNDARAIDYVFTRGAKHYHKGKYNEGLRPLMGNGVFLAEGDSWWKQRRDMAPVFSGKNFPDFTEQVVVSVEAMLKRWEPRIERGEPIDLALETPWLTFDVILRALYHQESGEFAYQIRECQGRILRMAESRIWSLFNLPLSLTMRRPKYARTMRFLDSLTQQLIDRRRENGAYPDDLLSRLIGCHGTTPSELRLLRDNILSFMLAGQETTGNAISWAFYELGRNTEVRRRLVSEVDAILGQERPSYETAKQLTYAWQTFSEILRMYAPAWTMSRHTISEDLIPLEDGRQLRVPAGTTVMLCAYTMQHNERYWEDPEAFMPERFTPDAVASRPKGTWFPFGGGNRLCLGFRLAELEGILAMTMIYQKYDVKLIPGQRIGPEPIITLRPDKPVLVRLTPRDTRSDPVGMPARDGPTLATASVCPYASRQSGLLADA